MKPTTETELIQAIVDELDGTTWTPQTLGNIAELLTDFGYPIADRKTKTMGAERITQQGRDDVAAILDETKR